MQEDGTITVLFCVEGNLAVWQDASRVPGPPLTERLGGRVTAFAAAALAHTSNAFTAVAGFADGSIKVIHGEQQGDTSIGLCTSTIAQPAAQDDSAKVREPALSYLAMPICAGSLVSFPMLFNGLCFFQGTMYLEE